MVLPAAELSPLKVVSFGCLWLYVFILVSRASEFIDRGDNIHMAFVSAGLATVGALATGGFLKAFTHRIGISLGLFTLWLLVEAPFSTWRSGSFQNLTEGWLKSYLTFIIVAALIFSMKQVRGLYLSIALATTFAVVVSMFAGVESAQDSRLATVEGTFSNANDLAAQLLMGLPFLLYCAGDRERNIVFRLISVATVPFLLVVVLRTGSRGGLVAVAVLAIIYIIKTTMAKRLLMIAALTAMVIVAPMVMSQEVKDRYMGLFLNGGAQLNDVQASAKESAETRAKLMEDAFTLTKMHPFLGVGIGQFAPQAAYLAASRGESAAWRPAHSFIFLVMTETGLPGVTLYCAAILFAFLALWKISKQARLQKNADVLALSRTLIFSYLAFTICALLSTNAYTFHVPLMSGLVMGFVRFAKPLLDSKPKVVEEPRPLGRYGRWQPAANVAR